MRHFLMMLLIASLVCCAGTAVAGGKIALYADASRESCELIETFPTVVQLHLFYEGDFGAQSVLFVAPTPSCWHDTVWLADVIFDPYLAGLGDTHDGASGTLINLRGCRTGPIYLGYMSFQTMGRGESCCTYYITGSEQTPEPGVIDCANNFVAVETGALVVKPTGACRCVEGNIVVAVEETTWGQIKSLYR